MSTARQNVVVAHDTEASPVPPSMGPGADQAVPLKLSAFPPLSTAMQKVGLTQDTEESALLPTDCVAPPGSTGWGTDHDVPFQARMFPTLSPATQNEAVAHETASSWPEVSTSWGCVQLRPSHREVPPAVAIQNVGLTQEMLFGPPQAFTADDQFPS